MTFVYSSRLVVISLPLNELEGSLLYAPNLFIRPYHEPPEPNPAFTPYIVQNYFNIILLSPLSSKRFLPVMFCD